MNIIAMDVFGQVMRHFRRMTGPSMVGNDCAYRDKSGNRCFIGCLIADEAYSPEMEGRPVRAHAIQEALCVSGVPVGALPGWLLPAIQDAHDLAVPLRSRHAKEWRRRAAERLESIRSQLTR